VKILFFFYHDQYLVFPKDHTSYGEICQFKIQPVFESPSSDKLLFQLYVKNQKKLLDIFDIKGNVDTFRLDDSTVQQ